MNWILISSKYSYLNYNISGFKTGSGGMSAYNTNADTSKATTSKDVDYVASAK